MKITAPTCHNYDLRMNPNTDDEDKVYRPDGKLELLHHKIIYFKGRNFRDFAIFGKIRESLFPRNIC